MLEPEATGLLKRERTSKGQWNSKEEGENCVVEYQEGFPKEVAASLRDAVTGSSKDG